MSRISVVVVSDYLASERKNWADERAVLQAFAAQDLAEPFEIIVVAPERHRQECPDWMVGLVPGSRIHFAPHERSSQLKDAATPLCTGGLIAVVEADSVPAPSWLRRLVEAMDREPAIDVMSGRTTYGDHSSLRRVLGVLDRAWMDPGQPGPSTDVSNNGALYRRALLERFPYPDEPSAFVSARIRNRAILASGARVCIEPRAVMVHGFGGLRFEVDMRRNVGFADGREYRRDLGLQRFSAWALAALVRRRLAQEWGDCRRLGARYLRWYDWPLAILMLGCVRAFELPGTVAGLRGASALEHTAYR